MVDERRAHQNSNRPLAVRGATDRSFGLVFTAFFFMIGLLPLTSGGAIRLWAILLAALFGALALAFPRALIIPNRLWFRFGMLLQKITHPLIMAIIFYGVVSPMALILRAVGKDLLRMRWEPEVKTYWIERVPPGPAPDSMKNQF